MNLYLLTTVKTTDDSIRNAMLCRVELDSIPFMLLDNRICFTMPGVTVTHLVYSGPQAAYSMIRTLEDSGGYNITLDPSVGTAEYADGRLCFGTQAPIRS